MQHNTRRRTHRSTMVHLAIAVLCTTLAVVGCKDITSLKQQDPGQLSGETVFVPANAQLIVNGVGADFECAYTRYVVGERTIHGRARECDCVHRGLSSTTAATLPTNAFYGTTDCVGVQVPGIYTPLSVSRASADTAAAALEGWTDEQVPNRALLIATSYAYGGYSLTLLGEKHVLGRDQSRSGAHAGAALRGGDHALRHGSRRGDDCGQRHDAQLRTARSCAGQAGCGRSRRSCGGCAARFRTDSMCDIVQRYHEPAAAERGLELDVRGLLFVGGHQLPEAHTPRITIRALRARAPDMWEPMALRPSSSRTRMRRPTRRSRSRSGRRRS